jgi:hypothetical protein
MREAGRTRKMKRIGTTGLGIVLAFVILAGLGSGSAAAAGNRKLVEGTVYDTTCATSCLPECPPPPHCGPITARMLNAVVCPQAQRAIVCPLTVSGAGAATPRICLQGSPCGGITYPVYSGEGAVVNVRKRGSSNVLTTLPVLEGHFKIRLGAGEYVLHPYLPEAQCWSGLVERVKVTAKTAGPIPASIEVTNACVAYPDAR